MISKKNTVDKIIFRDESPIVQFMDKIFFDAVDVGASDIHFESFEDKFVIRYRMDGELLTLDDCEKGLASPVLLRLKVLSNLNISESRLPQDGSMTYEISGKPVEFRISSLPTQFGESVVLRVLNNESEFFSLDYLMKDYPDLIEFLKNIINQRGLILFVGPTGCGKSTTLYSVLREINTEEIKILTCEDPVEQRIYGISQSNINVDIGFSFATALRSFLRHDPDIIFVGEIRDKETADLAIRAAITGHCVLSTLHANDAASAIPRLIDLGVDKMFVAEALLCIIHQRLERIDGENSDSRFLKVKTRRKAKFDTLFINDHQRHMIKTVGSKLD